MTELGRLTGIWRFPVKSMQGEGLAAGMLTERGLPGDRAWGVVEDATGRVLSAKREPRLMEATAFSADGSVRVRLPDGMVCPPGPDVDKALTAWLGRDVRLLRAEDHAATYEMNVSAVDEDSAVIELPCPPGTYFDAAAVHLLSTSSLATMAARQPGSRWDLHRFRPTLLVDTDGSEGFPEDEWIGEEIVVGAARLRVFAPTVRCRMTVHEQPGLARDLDIARAVNREHDGNLGVYAVVVTPGRVAASDSVTTG
ncbi:MAG: uncharacterized protein QOE35_2582 [Actinomycetota bacterium]|jgi:uncharacterized protein YcbX